jgi:hypothetical protein
LAPLKRMAAALLLCAGPLLPAQELSDIALYFAPARGGSTEEREFFDLNLPREITGAHYRVVESPAEADFLVTVAITEDVGPNHADCFVLDLIIAANNCLLLEICWDYVDPAEMRSWRIGSILAPENSHAALPSTIFIKGGDQL